MSEETSPKQVAANRRNALKSTGPRTPQGRAVSRLNALQHGILSKEVLVSGLNIVESEEELQALHRRFWEELQPAGPLEEMLIDQIVTAQWRLRRALTAESAEIALSVDVGLRERSRGTPPLVLWMKWTALGDPVQPMQESSLGNSLLRDWLCEARRAVEAEGVLTEDAVQRLAEHFRGEPSSLVHELEAFRQALAAEPHGRAAAVRERHKTEALAFLDRKIRDVQIWLERRLDEEGYEEDARQAAAVLPSAETLEKILRYEKKLERQIYRAMAQLERLQRMRRGETIPAPLSVDIADRG